MPYKVEKSVNLDGLPYEGAEVCLTSSGLVDVYTPPVLVTDNPSLMQVDIQQKGITTVTMLQAGTATATEQTASIDSSSQNGVYVWQRDTTNNNKIFDAVSNVTPFEFNDLDRADINTSAVVRVQGTQQASAVTGSVLSGTVVLTLQDRAIRFFDSSGVLRGIADANDGLNWAGQLFFAVASFNAAINDSVTVYFDKTTFPYDINLGDLGAYLAANPDWKQVNEQNSTQEVLSLGRGTTDANGVFSIDVGEYSGEVKADVYINGIKPQVKRFMPTEVVFVPSQLVPFYDVTVNGLEATVGSIGAAVRSVRVDFPMASDSGVYYWQVEGVNTSNGTTIEYGIGDANVFNDLNASGSGIGNNDTGCNNSMAYNTESNYAFIGKMINSSYAFSGANTSKYDANFKKTLVYNSDTGLLKVYRGDKTLADSFTGKITDCYAIVSKLRSNTTIKFVLDPSEMVNLPDDLPVDAKPLGSYQ